jgi:hypothetical protein
MPEENKMYYKNTIFLFFLVVFLAVLIYLFEFQMPSTCERDNKLLITADFDNISSLCINSSEKDYAWAAEFKDGLWFLNTPENEILSKKSMQIIINTLKTLTYKNDFQLNQSENFNLWFGNNTKNLKLSFKDKKNKITEQIFYFGKIDPFNKYIYTKKNGCDNKIYLISLAVFDSFFKPLYFIRDKKVIKYNISDINKISLIKENKNILFKKLENEWIIEKPYKMPLIQAGIKNLLSALADLKVISFNVSKLTFSNNYVVKSNIVLFSSLGIQQIEQIYDTTEKISYVKDNYRKKILKVNKSLDIEKLADFNFYRNKNLLQTGKKNILSIAVLTDVSNFILVNSKSWALEKVFLNGGKTKTEEFEVNLNVLEKMIDFFTNSEYLEHVEETADLFYKMNISVRITIDSISRSFIFYSKKGDQFCFYIKIDGFYGYYKFSNEKMKNLTFLADDFILPIIIDLNTNFILEIHRMDLNQVYWKKEESGWKYYKNGKKSESKISNITKILTIFDKFSGIERVKSENNFNDKFNLSIKITPIGKLTNWFIIFCLIYNILLF